MTQATDSNRSVARGKSGKISLRAIGREIGVSHSLLSKWKKGERNLKPEVEARYWEVVTTGGQNGDKRGWLERSPDETATPTASVGEDWWGIVDSNHGPQSYQDCALTS